MGEESRVWHVGDSITGLQVEFGCWHPVGDSTPGHQGESSPSSADM